MQFAVSVVTGTGIEASVASEGASFGASIVVESLPPSVGAASLPASMVDPEDDPEEEPEDDPDDVPDVDPDDIPDVDPDDIPDVDPDDVPDVDPDDVPDVDPDIDPLPEPEMLPCESGTEPSDVPFDESPPQPDATEAIRVTTLR